MSDTQSSPFFSALGQGVQGFANDVAYDPATQGLLTMGARMATAGGPSRLPVPFATAFAQGAEGFGQGTQQALKAQQEREQLRQMQLNNAITGAMAPAKIQAAQQLFGGSSGANLPFGVPSMPGAGGSPGQSGSSSLGYAGASATDPATQAIQMLLQKQRYALAFGDSRTASTLQQQLDNIAGPGAVIGQDGKIYQVPGAYQTRFNAKSAEAAGTGFGALPYNEANDAYKAGLDRQTHAVNAGVDATYAPPIVTTQLGPDGQYHETYTPVPAWAAQNGAPGQLQGQSGAIPGPVFADRVRATENATGNPAAGNPASSAVGNGQFLSGTWVPLFRQTFPQASQGMSDQQLLSLRSDPQISSAMTLAYARQNAPILAQAGAPVTAGTLGMAHQLGPQGALSVLRAPDAAPLSSVLPPDVIQVNPQLGRETAGDYKMNSNLRFGFAPVDLGGGAQLGRQPPQAGAAAPTAPSGSIVGKPVLTPEQTAASSGLGAMQTAVTEAGAKAPVGLQRLAVIDNAAQNFRPGLTGDARLTAARAMTDGLQSLGITPPSWISNGAAAGETIGKEGGYLATELTRSLGSREALGVFNQVRNISPNIEMSNGGFQVVTNSIRQGLMRDQDLAHFQDQWLSDPSHQGSIRGMQQAFEQKYPMQSYASRVVPFPMPKSAAQAMPNVIYNTARGPALWDGQQFRAVQ